MDLCLAAFRSFVVQWLAKNAGCWPQLKPLPMYGILLSCQGWCLQLLLGIVRKPQKRICMTVGPSLAAFLEALAHCRIVAGLSLLYRYYFGRCSSELARLFPLPFSRGRSTPYSDRFHDFSVTIPRCYQDVYVNSFFSRTGKLQNSLPIDCFPLTYYLSGFKSRINRHLLTVGSF